METWIDSASAWLASVLHVEEDQSSQSAFSPQQVALLQETFRISFKMHQVAVSNQIDAQRHF